MSITDKVERDMRRLEIEGSLLLEDPELWVLKITRVGRGWTVTRRNYEDENDDLAFNVFTDDIEYVRSDIRTFRAKEQHLLEHIESL